MIVKNYAPLKGVTRAVMLNSLSTELYTRNENGDYYDRA